MNIKEHIEAGHYPKDEKGRALVPMRGGGTATICATDCPSDTGRPLLGWINTTNLWHGWPINGTDYHDTHSLLPPPPRKVKVTGRVFVDTEGRIQAVVRPHHNPRDFLHWGVLELADFSVEYDEPWS